ncbi:hypothetical protein LOTGIDRAFT_157454 [Lottia gigantea]|uniref:Uncharacterized protein n=1 Tax=Lottia gigantea TaxID=225164 RepID=V4AVB3_LOTGI|nr:hypothetical protein LOTGIDRAFT_157454 [Lottia gigantea]ESP01278.1 hypothetical protein LOTGIDRAFT_157454 [Lottia gigantea]
MSNEEARNVCFNSELIENLQVGHNNILNKYGSSCMLHTNHCTACESVALHRSVSLLDFNMKRVQEHMATGMVEHRINHSNVMESLNRLSLTIEYMNQRLLRLESRQEDYDEVHAVKKNKGGKFKRFLKKLLKRKSKADDFYFDVISEVESPYDTISVSFGNFEIEDQQSLNEGASLEHQPFRGESSEDQQSFRGESSEDQQSFRGESSEDQQSFRGESSEDQQSFRGESSQDQRQFRGQSSQDQRPFRGQSSHDQQPFRGQSSHDQRPLRRVLSEGVYNNLSSIQTDTSDYRRIDTQIYQTDPDEIYENTNAVTVSPSESLYCTVPPIASVNLEQRTHQSFKSNQNWYGSSEWGVLY